MPLRIPLEFLHRLDVMRAFALLNLQSIDGQGGILDSALVKPQHIEIQRRKDVRVGDAAVEFLIFVQLQQVGDEPDRDVVGGVLQVLELPLDPLELLEALVRLSDILSGGTTVRTGASKAPVGLSTFLPVGSRGERVQVCDGDLLASFNGADGGGNMHQG